MQPIEVGSLLCNGLLLMMTFVAAIGLLVLGHGAGATFGAVGTVAFAGFLSIVMTLVICTYQPIYVNHFRLNHDAANRT